MTSLPLASIAPVSFTATVKFDHPASVFVLQQGGWLPVSLSGASVLLLDRNIIATCKLLRFDPNRQDLVGEKWWMEFMNAGDRYLLNTTLAAAEGSLQRTPTLNEFVTELLESAHAVHAALPSAKLVAFSDADVRRIYDMFAERLASAKRLGELLEEACPLVVDRVGTSSLRKTEDRLLVLARKHGVGARSLTVIALLSCLYESAETERASVGRLVLKPSHAYGPERAHNAVSDLLALDYLAVANSHASGSIGLCTRDKGLLAFWLALGVSGGDPSASPFVATCNPIGAELFPRLSDVEVAALLARLSAS